jgi:DNA invertase Pin-like site-specific DNA recombinase
MDSSRDTCENFCFDFDCSLIVRFMKKKTAIYLRVSTNEQNIENQRQVLINYLEQRGFELYKIYEDVGTGSNEKRLQLNSLLSDARKRKFDAVLVWKFDRFARSTSFLIRTLDEFHALGIDFISYDENIDTSSAMGKVMFTVISAFAEFEKSILISRTKLGLERARAEGKIIGRPKLEEAVIGKINKLRKQGLSIGKIADKMKLSKGVIHKYIEK